jgi:dTMP kinase
MKGRFITIEGIDGTGKSTQLELLARRMQEEGYDVVVTKEPGSPVENTGLGLALRQILFHTVTTHNMARGVADLLFLADHVQHVEKVVEPALEAGKVVISDRYADSQFAYAECKNGGRCPGWVLEAYTAAFGPIPDITLLFVSADPAVTLQRAWARRGDNNKQAGKVWNEVDQQNRIQQAYLSRLVGQDRTIVITIYPEQTPGQIFEMVWEAVNDRLYRPAEYTENGESKVIPIV